jgi:hypothetical protein
MIIFSRLVIAFSDPTQLLTGSSGSCFHPTDGGFCCWSVGSDMVMLKMMGTSRRRRVARSYLQLRLNLITMAVGCGSVVYVRTYYRAESLFTYILFTQRRAQSNPRIGV